MTKGKGYLLPSGDASEDDLECCIVFYPARDEYRRALMGSLDYLATWIAWERDSEKRGQDAAASWKLANIQTWECTNMGYCDDLATTLQALLAATQALECCGDQDISDGELYTDDVVDGVGNVPQNIIDAGYASGPTDWAGFDDYKCMISHLAVNHIETFFREIAPFVSSSGVVIGGIGVVAALLGAILAIVGLPISAGIIVALGASAGIWTWISTYGKTAVTDLADEIATNHDALACAIYDGDGVADAIDDFNAEVDSLFSAIDAIAIKAVGFQPQLRAMYAGRYDQEDIAEKLDGLGYDVMSYDCSTCDVAGIPEGYHLVYPISIQSFTYVNCNEEDSGYQASTGTMRMEITSTGGNWKVYTICNLPGSPSVHGYVFRLLSGNHPEDALQFMLGTVPPYHVYPAEVEIGEYAAGYDTGRHSGSEWDDWVASYDSIENFSDASHGDRFNLQDFVSPQQDRYNFQFRLWFLVPD